MNRKILVILTAFMTAAITLTAQQPSDLKMMQTAFKYRTDLVKAIENNKETSEAALQRLRANVPASSSSINREADFAHAALDIGHQLLIVGRPDAAEIFFRAAEKSLESLANQTVGTQARERAQYLQKLALLRSKYLNEKVQAKADINAAVALQPGDTSLEQTRIRLAVVPGDLFNGKVNK